MITLYTKIPDSKKDKTIYDVERFFENTYRTIMKHPEYKYIISSIDKALPKDDSILISQFGEMNIINLSSGCKALLIAIVFNDLIVNFTEAGDNILDLALELSNKYNFNILITREMATKNVLTKVKYNGVIKPYINVFREAFK